MSNTAGLNPTRVTAAREFSPGDLGATAETEYVYVRAGSRIPSRGAVLTLTAANTARPLSNRTASAGDRVGVAPEAAETGQYFWAAVRGNVQIHVAAGYVAGSALYPTADPGVVDDAAEGPVIAGLEGAASTFAASGLVSAWASFPRLAVEGTGQPGTGGLNENAVDARVRALTHRWAQAGDLGFIRSSPLSGAVTFQPAAANAATSIPGPVPVPANVGGRTITMVVDGTPYTTDLSDILLLPEVNTGNQLNSANAAQWTDASGDTFSLARGNDGAFKFSSSRVARYTVSLNQNDLDIAPWARLSNNERIPAAKAPVIPDGSVTKEQLAQTVQDDIAGAVEVDGVSISGRDVEFISADARTSKTITLPREVPAPRTDDAGKVPTINAGGTAYELQTPEAATGLNQSQVRDEIRPVAQTSVTSISTSQQSAFRTRIGAAAAGDVGLDQAAVDARVTAGTHPFARAGNEEALFVDQIVTNAAVVVRTINEAELIPGSPRVPSALKGRRVRFTGTDGVNETLLATYLALPAVDVSEDLDNSNSVSYLNSNGDRVHLARGSNGEFLFSGGARDTFLVTISIVDRDVEGWARESTTDRVPADRLPEASASAAGIVSAADYQRIYDSVDASHLADVNKLTNAQLEDRDDLLVQDASASGNTLRELPISEADSRWQPATWAKEGDTSAIPAGKLTNAPAGAATSDEKIQDVAAKLLTDGDGTVAATYDDGAGEVDLNVRPSSIRPSNLAPRAAGAVADGQFVKVTGQTFETANVAGITVIHDASGAGRSVPSAASDYESAVTGFSPAFDLDDVGDGIIYWEADFTLASLSANTIRFKAGDERMTANVSARAVRQSDAWVVGGEHEGIAIGRADIINTARAGDELQQRIGEIVFYATRNGDNELQYVYVIGGMGSGTESYAIQLTNLVVQYVAALASTAPTGHEVPAYTVADAGEALRVAADGQSVAFAPDPPASALDALSAIPDTAGYTVGDIADVNGALYELVDDAADGNVISGVAAQRSGGYYGTAKVEWLLAEGTTPRFRCLLSRDALGTSPRATIVCQLQTGSAYTTFRLTRDSARDTGDDFGYSSGTGSELTGVVPEAATAGAGAQFYARFYTDQARTTNVNVHSADRWELYDRKIAGAGGLSQNDVDSRIRTQVEPWARDDSTAIPAGKLTNARGITVVTSDDSLDGGGIPGNVLSVDPDVRYTDAKVNARVNALIPAARRVPAFAQGDAGQAVRVNAAGSALEISADPPIASDDSLDGTGRAGSVLSVDPDVRYTDAKVNARVNALVPPARVFPAYTADDTDKYATPNAGGTALVLKDLPEQAANAVLFHPDSVLTRAVDDALSAGNIIATADDIRLKKAAAVSYPTNLVTLLTLGAFNANLSGYRRPPAGPALGSIQETSYVTELLLAAQGPQAVTVRIDGATESTLYLWDDSTLATLARQANGSYTSNTVLSRAQNTAFTFFRDSARTQPYKVNPAFTLEEAEGGGGTPVPAPTAADVGRILVVGNARGLIYRPFRFQELLFDGPGASVIVTNSKASQHGAFQKFTLNGGLDLDNVGRGELHCAAQFTISPRSSTTIGFDADHKTDASVNALIFASQIKAAMAYSASSLRGVRIGPALSIYEGATKVGEISILIAKDDNNELGYFASYKIQAGTAASAAATRNFTAAFNLEVDWSRSDAGETTGGVDELLAVAGSPELSKSLGWSFFSGDAFGVTGYDGWLTPNDKVDFQLRYALSASPSITRTTAWMPISNLTDLPLTALGGEREHNTQHSGGQQAQPGGNGGGKRQPRPVRRSGGLVQQRLHPSQRRDSFLHPEQSTDTPGQHTGVGALICPPSTSAKAFATARRFGRDWVLLCLVLAGVGWGIHTWAERVQARVDAAISTLERIDEDLRRHETGSEGRFGRMERLLLAICHNAAETPGEHAQCAGVE